MKNCLVLGSGRSGTSMIGGILHDAGYFMGKNLHPPRHSNPKGFFESIEINRINENILAKYDERIPVFKRFFTKHTVHRPGQWQRWLMALPPTVNVTDDNKKTARRIKVAVSQKPFAYKDPRFSYTLPVWKPHLDKDTVFICVFREPNITVKSILKECASMRYLRNLQIDEQTAYESWYNIYFHVLEKHMENTPEVVFVHFNQIFNGSALPRLSGLLNANLEHDFVDKGLKRTTTNSVVSNKIRGIYNRLCGLAGYSEKEP